MEEKIEILWPSGKCVQQQQSLAPRLDTSDGKTICGIHNGNFHFDQTWLLVKQLLSNKYPAIKFVDWEEFGIVSDKEQGVVLEALPDKLRKHGCNGVISSRGCFDYINEV
ncbi:hypothetical protein ACFLT4_00405 [Chloroflexota bacterium]